MIRANKNQTTATMSRPGLQLLLQAHEYAHELDREDWDFAVELPDLQKAGLTSGDLRWLLCKGHADQARETTSESDSGRSFRHQNQFALRKHSCFVLTNSGVEFVRNFVSQLDTESNESIPLIDYSSRLLGSAASNGANSNGANGNGANSNGANGNGGGADGELNGAAVRTSDYKSTTPRWDCDRQELRLNSQVVKEFRLHSPNQVMILTAFEEEGWPPKIDDPLPPHADIDAKQRLHDTIKSLNRNQKRQLIRFRGDGTGQGIRWELTGTICT